ncbi:hypothetical protein [Deinococcus sp.]|uniref:hypothetical protein n=1 Tax=Deinococcus sp. TaxID=47478 RepID=UPI0025BD043A|nr:hypothetical protein [Deinococcus sp.]
MTRSGPIAAPGLPPGPARIVSLLPSPTDLLFDLLGDTDSGLNGLQRPFDPSEASGREPGLRT